MLMLTETGTGLGLGFGLSLGLGLWVGLGLGPGIGLRLDLVTSGGASFGAVNNMRMIHRVNTDTRRTKNWSKSNKRSAYGRYSGSAFWGMDLGRIKAWLWHGRLDSNFWRSKFFGDK